MSRTIYSYAVAVLACLALNHRALGAGGDPNYGFTIDAPATVSEAAGNTVQFEATVELTIQAGATPVCGFSLGIAHSGPGICNIIAVGQGPPLAQMNGGDGAALITTTLPPGGATMEVVFDFFWVSSSFLGHPRHRAAHC